MKKENVFQESKKENHLTLVSEPKSEFISSLADDHIDDDDLKGAELEAKLILDFLSENGMEENLEILGCDSTRVNSGRTNGVTKQKRRNQRRKRPSRSHRNPLLSYTQNLCKTFI